MSGSGALQGPPVAAGTNENHVHDSDIDGTNSDGRAGCNSDMKVDDGKRGNSGDDMSTVNETNLKSG